MKNKNTLPEQTPDGINALKLGFINDNLSGLLGQVLTIVDAATEGDKNKAMKDLIKQVFSAKQEWFCECSWVIEAEAPHHPACPALVNFVNLGSGSKEA
jgi:hypothetical protein